MHYIEFQYIQCCCCVCVYIYITLRPELNFSPLTFTSQLWNVSKYEQTPMAALTPWQAWNSPIIFWQVRNFCPGRSCVKHCCDMKWHVSCWGGGIRADIFDDSHGSRIPGLDGEAWGHMAAHHRLIERPEDLTDRALYKIRPEWTHQGTSSDLFSTLRIEIAFLAADGVWLRLIVRALRDQVQRLKTIISAFSFILFYFTVPYIQCFIYLML